MREVIFWAWFCVFRIFWSPLGGSDARMKRSEMLVGILKRPIWAWLQRFFNTTNSSFSKSWKILWRLNVVALILLKNIAWFTSLSEISLPRPFEIGVWEFPPPHAPPGFDSQGLNSFCFWPILTDDRKAYKMEVSCFSHQPKNSETM